MGMLIMSSGLTGLWNVGGTRTSADEHGYNSGHRQSKYQCPVQSITSMTEKAGN
jgi:hypothetical protein